MFRTSSRAALAAQGRRPVLLEDKRGQRTLRLLVVHLGRQSPGGGDGVLERLVLELRGAESRQDGLGRGADVVAGYFPFRAAGQPAQRLLRILGPLGGGQGPVAHVVQAGLQGLLELVRVKHQRLGNHPHVAIILDETA